MSDVGGRGVEVRARVRGSRRIGTRLDLLSSVVPGGLYSGSGIATIGWQADRRQCPAANVKRAIPGGVHTVLAGVDDSRSARWYLTVRLLIAGLAVNSASAAPHRCWVRCLQCSGVESRTAYRRMTGDCEIVTARCHEGGHQKPRSTARNLLGCVSGRLLAVSRSDIDVFCSRQIRPTAAQRQQQTWRQLFGK